MNQEKPNEKSQNSIEGGPRVLRREEIGAEIKELRKKLKEVVRQDFQGFKEGGIIEKSRGEATREEEIMGKIEDLERERQRLLGGE